MYNFDGSNDYVSIPLMTIRACVFQFRPYVTNRSLMGHTQITNPRMDYTGGNAVSLVTNEGASNSPSGVLFGRKNIVGVSCDGTNEFWNLNGTTGSTALGVQPLSINAIGRYRFNRYWAGQMFDALLFEDALTQAELASLVTDLSAVTADRHYTMLEGSGLVAVDVESGENGSLVGVDEPDFHGELGGTAGFPLSRVVN